MALYDSMDTSSGSLWVRTDTCSSYFLLRIQQFNEPKGGMEVEEDVRVLNARTLVISVD
jgi:hypothetical protein